jgi:DNA-binding IclR family transcriptional regulator
MGRPETINRLWLASLLKQGLGATEIAKQLGIGRASVYRLMSEPLL